MLMKKKSVKIPLMGEHIIEESDLFLFVLSMYVIAILTLPGRLSKVYQATVHSQSKLWRRRREIKLWRKRREIKL